ncbi:isotrichodermin C-15 hydroxylase protein [Rutstroemia sp. NJR-2017a BBW]|nr:isotrichodermin C-15 hydroxylase protein [Rutstroemia sp. NJR-2017a BBW]
MLFWKLKGQLPYKIKELHDRYGDVVRVAPTYLDYSSSTAWEEIYGFPKDGKGNFPKDLKERGGPMQAINIPSSINAGPEDHRRFRRLQAHAFSEKSLASQEPLIQDYAQQFVDGLIRFSATDDTIDLGRWYNFATFDLIGDLAFGEPFDCLKTGVMHSWIALIFSLFEVVVIISELRKYPTVGSLLMLLIPPKMRNRFINHKKLAAQKAERRMATVTDRPDFMTYIMRHNETEKGMTPDEIKENASILIIAGSETTASLLHGLTYFLLRNPPVLQNLTMELRTTFKTRSDLTLQALASCKYLNAVLEEGLRMYPPVPGNLPRMAPPEGTVIEGKYVPGRTTIGVHNWTANYSTCNFADPYTFHPERWLSSEDFENDDRKARQTFSYGPANCIGKNLAYAEMRLLLGIVVWGFDLEAGEGADTWLERNRVYGLWKKPPLNVKLTRVNV